MRFKIKQGYRELEKQNALITAETVKQTYLGVHLSQKGHTVIELLDYFEKIWKDKIKPGTFKNYITTIEYAKLFLKSRYTAHHVYLSQIEMEFATEFEHYIRHHPVKEHDPCLGNGVGKHIHRFKRILNWAVELKWCKVNPIATYRCPIKKSRRKKLTIQDLVILETRHFSDPALVYVQKLFLYSCYTGLAFVDAMQLELGHFEKDMHNNLLCKIYRTKSDELCAIPLIGSAATILNEYIAAIEGTNNPKIFPSISNQQVNRCLKLIAEICGFTIPLTFHVARHTFAKTVALKNGIPMETVQMMLGHTKITTTQIYADVDEEKIISDMSGLENKMAEKRKIVLAHLEAKSQTRVA